MKSSNSTPTQRRLPTQQHQTLGLTLTPVLPLTLPVCIPIANPNPKPSALRIYRTIAKALRVTKFDSVSTLLADYTGRNAKNASCARTPSKPTATGDTDNTGEPTSTLDDTWQRQQSRTAGGTAASKKRGRRNISSTGATMPYNSSPTHEFVYPKGKLENDIEPKLFAPSLGGGVGRKMVSVMTAGRTTRRNINRGASSLNDRGLEGTFQNIVHQVPKLTPRDCRNLLLFVRMLGALREPQPYAELFVMKSSKLQACLYRRSANGPK